MKTKGETFVMRKYNNGHKGTFKNRIKFMLVTCLGTNGWND